MPVWRCKEELSSSEFLDWCVYLQQEEERRKPIDYQFAMLTAEVRRSFVKNPAQVRIEHFFLKFEHVSTITSQQRMERSKQHWFMALGVKGQQ